MRIASPDSSVVMRVVKHLLALCLAGAAVMANAADRIFADGFEPCCTLGGEVTGLTGDGLVLHLAAGSISEDRPVPSNGGEQRLYTFVDTATPGTAYTVTIAAQPFSQICTLINASGITTRTPVDNVNATCVAGPADLNWDDGVWDDANWQ